MAATEILAVDEEDEDSSDVVVVAGTPILVCLKTTPDEPMPRRAFVRIFVKDDDDQFVRIGELTGRSPHKEISAAGTYMFQRVGMEDVPVGVFKAG